MKHIKMKKSALITAVVLLGATFFGAGMAYSQFWNETPPVVHITSAEITGIYDALPDPSRNQDQPAFITDMGPYNLGLNTQHRTAPQTQEEDGSIEFHALSAEVYYILEGSGTLVTQSGAMTETTRIRGYDKEENYKRLTDETLQFNAPTAWAIFDGPKVSRKFGPGDIIIIPPNTGHTLYEVDGDYVNYLVFRVDPYHSMPGGYVNPMFRRMGKMTPGSLGSGSGQ